jgi:hypothetical protein
VEFAEGRRWISAVAVSLEKTPEIGTRSRLFELEDSGAPFAGYDVTPDGQRFVVVRRGGSTRLTVVVNWN